MYVCIIVPVIRFDFLIFSEKTHVFFVQINNSLKFRFFTDKIMNMLQNQTINLTDEQTKYL